MSIKFILYLIIIPVVMWVITPMNFEKLFKKNKTNEITLFYVLITLGISYLVVNFIYDVYEVSIFIN